MLRASELARPGSVIPKQLRISPARSGWSQRTQTGIAGSAFTSFLFQNEIGFTVSNVAFAGDGIIAAATGITANSGAGATARVVDLAVASGTLNIVGPVSSANGMIAHQQLKGSELHRLPVEDQDVALIPYGDWAPYEQEIADTFLDFMRRNGAQTKGAAAS